MTNEENDFLAAARVYLTDSRVPPGRFIHARDLRVGDRFIPVRHLAAAITDGWHRDALIHELTDRGDYTTIVHHHTTWTERFDSNEWLYRVDGVITCPQCLQTSRHPDDVTNRYCGACHQWTGASDGGGVR